MLKPITHSALLFSLLLIFSIKASSQALSGTYTIPGSYATVAAAVTAINTNGISATVTFNIAAGTTETAPAGGYILTATGTASNQIIFQKSGAGANPLLTAYTGGTATCNSATALDGVFRIVGGDYITINGIDVQENALNLTNATQMEFGYGMFKASATNGCQNNTIENCNITLNKANFVAMAPTLVANGSMGILINNSTNSAPNTALAISTSGGLNSNNVLLNNNITNIFEGIYIRGYNAASPYTYYDQNNIVGRSGNGNIITNFGSGTLALATYGIYLYGQNADSIAGDSINNIANSGTAHTNTLTGIYQINSINSTIYIYKNKVYLTQGGNASVFACINTNLTGTGTININNNSVSGATSAAATGTYYGIYNQGLTNTFNASGNIQLSSTINTTANAFFISTTGGNAGSICSNNRIFGLNKTGVGGTLYGYYNATNTATSGTEVITYNSFSNLTVTGATSLTPLSTSTTDNQLKTVNNDTITACAGGTGNFICINIDHLGSASTINSNYITNSTGAGNVYGIYNNNVSTTEGTVTIMNNYISGINSTAVSGATNGIDNANIHSTLIRIVSNTIKNIVAGGTTSPTTYGIITVTGPGYAIDSNNINTFSAPSATTTSTNQGIRCLGSSTTTNIIGNTISGFGGNGTNNNNYGIYIQSNTASGISNVHGNSVSGFTGAAATTVNNYGIQIAAGAASSTTNVFSNKIKTFSSTGTTNSNFGVYVNGGATGSATSVYQNRIGSFTAAATTVNNYGIYVNGGAVGSLTTNINNDSIYSLTGSGTGLTLGIFNIGTVAGGSSANINNDSIIGLIGGANTYGIYQSNSANNNPTNVYSNTISNLNSTGANATNNEYGIFFYSGAGTSAIYKNKISTLTGSATTTNNDHGIFVQSNIASAITNVYQNSISGVAGTATTNNNYGIQIGAGLATTQTYVFNDTIKSLSASGTTNNNYGVFNTAGASGSAASIYSNKINTFSGTATTVNNYGIYNTGGVSGALGTLIYSNNISGLTGVGTTNGVYTGSATAGGPSASIFNDTISGLTGSVNTTGIIQVAATVNNTNIYNNYIYNLSGTIATSLTYGIQTNTGATNTIYNNFISDLRASISNTSNAVIGIYASGGTSDNVYYNTVYLNTTSSGTNFGSSAVAFAAAVALDSRNNILTNKSTYNGTGLTAALLRTSTTAIGTPPATTNYASTSGYNAFYVPTTAGNYYSYADATTNAAANNKFTNGCGASGFTAYRKFMSNSYANGRDTVSVFELPPFVNTSGTPYDLHLSTSTGTRVESGSINIAGITTDADGNVRQGNVGYAGTGSAPDMGAAEFNGSNKTSTSISWVGGVSNNWNNTANWCPYIPNAGDNVTISSGYTFAPFINTTGTCNNITLNASTALTINTGATFSLNGNFTNSGTYTNTAGTLALVGSTAQTIPALSNFNLTLNNSNGATVSPAGTLTVSGTLTLSAGALSANTVNVTNSAASAVTGYQTDPTLGAYASSAYVNGVLNRTVTGTGQYDFPIGTASQYELASYILSGITGTSTLQAQYTTSNAGCTSPNPDTVSVNGTPIQTLLDGGYWIITPDIEPTGGTYSVYLNERGYTYYPGDPAQLTVIKRSNCTSAWHVYGTHSNSTQKLVNNTAHAERTGLASFSNQGIGWGDQNLPVRLVSFNAFAVNTSPVHTNWVVASQDNNRFFNVQRSADGATFYTVGTLEGCGTCNTSRQYTFDDKEALNGVSYYRLQMVDGYGKYTYSNIKEVNVYTNTPAVLSLSPNPNQGNFEIDVTHIGSAKTADVKILNILGEVLSTQTLNITNDNMHVVFNNTNLNTGVYFVKILVDGQSLITKMIIQK